MPNGNTLITIFGVPPLYEINIIEIDENGSLQWEYLGSFITFRASKHPLSYFNNGVIVGDLNGDDIIDILDLIILVNMILDGEYSVTGDLNEDNVNNILDIVIYLNIILSN